MSNNKEIDFFLSQKKKFKIKIMLKVLKSNYCREYIQKFLNVVINCKKTRKKWTESVDENIIDQMLKYLNKYNGKEFYNYIYSFCNGCEKKQYYLIKNIINNNEGLNIDISLYFNEIKKHIINFSKKFLSVENKRKLIKEIEIKRIKAHQADNIITLSHKNQLIEDKFFINNLDKRIKEYEKHCNNSVGFMIALLDVFKNWPEPLSFKDVKNSWFEIIKKEKYIDLENVEINESYLSYNVNFSQVISFNQQIEYSVLLYRLAQNIIVKEKISTLIKYRGMTYGDLKWLESMLDQNFYRKHNCIIKNDEREIMIQCIYSFLAGYHNVILGVLPVLEKIYKRAYEISENTKNGNFIVDEPALYNNKMIRNIFLKNSQLKENIEESKYFCLNIKNDFFHYKFLSSEIMECMSMYVFEFLLKEYIFE